MMFENESAEYYLTIFFSSFGRLFLMSMELVQPEITRVTMPISLNVLKFTTMKPQVCTYEIEY